MKRNAIIIFRRLYLRSLFICAEDRFFVTGRGSECKYDPSCQKHDDNTVPNDSSRAWFQLRNYHSREYNDQRDQAGLQNIWKN